MVLGYILCLMAALFWGTNHILIKIGVTDLTTPLVGATVSTFVGSGLLSTVAAKDYVSTIRSQGLSLIFLFLAGAAAAAGMALQFMAFALVPVTIGSPLTCSYPVITAGLAHLFLKRTETVTLRVVIGALCVVVGGTLITLGRPR